MRNTLIITLCLTLSACSTVSYYGQSVMGQMDLLNKRQDIEELIQAPDTPLELKTKLQQAREIRHFASNHIKLPRNRSYLRYADLERPYVVWNVFAAPEFSLEPKSWCYLIIGCVSYRGYFAEGNAITTAEALKDENYDVHVAGISVYSTLGWFEDPLLNTMINWNERALASMIFHELSHQVIYISSETAFNEAFSSAVERLATIQWLIKNNKPYERYLSYLTAQQDFRELLLDTRAQLETIYELETDIQDKRQKKQDVFNEMKARYESMKAQWPKGIHFDKWFSKPINNARLTATMTYLQQIPGFYQIFIENKKDWDNFFNYIKSLEKLSKEERDSLIRTKIEKAPNINKIATLLLN